MWLRYDDWGEVGPMLVRRIILTEEWYSWTCIWSEDGEQKLDNTYSEWVSVTSYESAVSYLQARSIET